MTTPASTVTVTRRRLLGAGLGLAASAPVWAEEPAAPLVVYAVRHAEKGTGDDPPLTEAGTARAERLAAALRDVPLQAVFSTATRRTRSTAEPAAKGHQLEVTTYAPKAGVLAKTLAGLSGAVLVVGHSNTIPALLRELGAELALEELEGNDDLFLLVRAPGSAVSRPLLQRLHYGG